MGASREGFNLLNKFGRYNFFKRGGLRSRWVRTYFLRDTFGRYVCGSLGHSKKTFVTDDCPSKIICYRCFRELANDEVNNGGNKCH